jgi:hypothetical protein
MEVTCRHVVSAKSHCSASRPERAKKNPGRFDSLHTASERAYVWPGSKSTGAARLDARRHRPSPLGTIYRWTILRALAEDRKCISDWTGPHWNTEAESGPSGVLVRSL